MKKIIPLLLLVFMFTVSCGNSRGSDSFRNKYENMKSYTSIAEITVHGKKVDSKYKVIQYYMEPYFVRIETKEPDFLKGKLLIYSGTKWKIYNPIINETFETTNLKEQDELIHLGIIKKAIILSNNSSMKMISKDGKNYIMIQNPIPGATDYRNKVNIYFNKKDNHPELMEILDKNNNIVVDIKYSQFEYNREIKKSLFN